jgi:hypothetical protein
MRVGFGDVLKEEALPDPNPEKFAELERMFQSYNLAVAYVAPRGIGPTEWTRDKKERTHIRRRFMLLGQTDDGMRVWDVRRAVRAVRALDRFRGAPLSLWMQGKREMAGTVLYASLFEPEVDRVDMWEPTRSHRDGPIFLNVLRYLDIPQAVAMAGERSQVRIHQANPSDWEYPLGVAKSLAWDDQQIEIEPDAAEPAGK